MDIAQLLYRLQTDNTSGASTLLDLALDIVEAFAVQTPAHSFQDFRTALEALIAALLTAQPSMAPFINLAHAALQVCDAESPPDVALRQLRQTLTALRQQARPSITALCLHQRHRFFSLTSTQTVIPCHHNLHVIHQPAESAVAWTCSLNSTSGVVL